MGNSEPQRGIQTTPHHRRLPEAQGTAAGDGSTTWENTSDSVTTSISDSTPNGAGDSTQKTKKSQRRTVQRTSRRSERAPARRTVSIHRRPEGYDDQERKCIDNDEDHADALVESFSGLDTTMRIEGLGQGGRGQTDHTVMTDTPP